MGGPNATAMIVTCIPGKIWSFTSFGTFFVTDDSITEAPDPNSAIVGRGRGMYITSMLDGSTTHVLISIMFTNGQFSGSTLGIQCSNPHFQKYREVFVVRTERLRFERGYAIFETVFVDTPIGYSVINFWAPCRVVKDERSLSVNRAINRPKATKRSFSHFISFLMDEIGVSSTTFTSSGFILIPR